jgi:hypothetical protein
MAVIAMGVSDQHGIQASDLRREQLLPKVGPAIDQQALARTFDEE